ncbi:dynein assembly factor 3, axonemal [Rana temporaria]|uniref:dynein assembly factor 3, axonemal n=1 Tax=Rana temporaria TaxID=8407 RepID=UPI001AACF008|nr:dynein assembly factor 3, axonemal [Rana temporaria]XP_040181704.1 dynein assembly factor 3, axonemal [Rana temporaria]XP_040181705.1 dynein assembly factor 3, axonemal [Rana temporaria]
MASGGSGEVYPTLWGFSPALDLQMHCRQSTLQYLNTCDDIPELNILLVGCGDGRHLLKTVCQARRWPHRKLHFFIIESDLELLARQMLFLTLALETSEKMGLQEKCDVFLELFGNSLVRSKTATYLQEKCAMFIRCVTDPEYQQNVLPQLDMSSIKFKERDELEYIFKFWQSPEPKLFPIERYWDVKNRQYLGRRYDSRRGAYDWDLNMKLHDHGAVMISAIDYNRWRENGVAFTIREGNYDVPNKTLASQMIVTHRCGKVRARGYWGDITTSPYIAYGIETEEKSLLKTANGVHTKTAQDLSKFNITAMFHELVTGLKYSPSVLSKDEAEDNSACNVSTRRETEATIQEEVTEEKNGSTDYILKIDNIEIHFLPLSWVNELHRRSKFLDLFNLVFFSCSMVHYLNAEYKLITARKATLIVELTKFMVDLHVDKVKSYVTIVTKVAKEAGFTTTENIDWKRDYIATFERSEDCVEEKNGH